MMGVRVISIPVLSLLFCHLWGCSRAAVTEILFRGTGEESSTAKLPENLPNVTESGYLPLASGTKDALFYAYYTAEEHLKSSSRASAPPILVWLQVKLRPAPQIVSRTWACHVATCSNARCRCREALDAPHS